MITSYPRTWERNLLSLAHQARGSLAAPAIKSVAAAGELYGAILNDIEAHTRYRITERMLG